MKIHSVARFIISVVLPAFLLSVLLSCVEEKMPQAEKIIGEWKGKVQFKSGMFASIKDLEFMRVFNYGGTLTESSNYDGVPPVPPAYGIWKKTGEKTYEAKYEFYTTNLPGSFEDLKSSGGFSPSGYGIITETITLNADRNSYSSLIMMALFDKTGNHISVDEADAEAIRMEF